MKDQNTPPGWILRFFRWFCHPGFVEDIEGDLLEIYERKLEEMSRRKANRQFFFAIISLLKPNLIRPLSGYNHLNHYGMYKNYFKIAWRSLWRQKLYSFINIGGLAIGLTCFILISLYIQLELSYDSFYSKADQIYRVYQRQEGNVFMDSDYFAVTPAGLSKALVTEYPEVEQATTIQHPSALISLEKKHFWEKGISADQGFFQVFDFPFIQGDPKTVLEKPNSIVLTKSLAKKIFGNSNPIGKTLGYKVYQSDQKFTITGVIQDPPLNSSFQFTFLVSIQSMDNYIRDMKAETWQNNSYYTFFVLKEGADPELLENKFPQLLKKYVDKSDDYPFKDTYLVQPLAELHLENEANFDIGLKGNTNYVYLFSFIALIVLLLACVNYMNLAIARSIKRAQEVGLRKVIGAVKNQLIGQFLGESILITFLALLLSLTFIQLLLPVFGYLLEREIEFDFIQNIYLLPGLCLLVILVGVVSGSYPAFYMSSLNPVQVIKGSSGKMSGKFGIQRWLIVGQFAVSIVLIISSIVIYRQFQFIQNKELGFDKDHVVTLRIRDQNVAKQFDVIKNEWSGNPKVVAVTSSGHLPTNIDSSNLISKRPKDNQEDNIAIYRSAVDYNFLDVFGIDLIAGRNFSRERKTDAERGFILNETAVKALGWTPEEAIGKQFYRYGSTYHNTIIGVVKDFHMHSMHQPMQPLMLFVRNEYISYISIKVKPESMQKTLSSLEKTFQKYTPYPFEYEFLDEKFDELYKADLRLGEIFGFFTILAILIATLGLFGLAAFSAQQKTKEIGIRKVLGASISSIISLLAKDFIRLVMLGFIIATPVAWYIMQQWLANFAFRITISWWIFVLAGGIAIVVALLTVIYQSLKAALTNPVEALRNE